MRGLNKQLAFAIFSGAFGSAFQHGYNTGVLNAPQHVLEEWITRADCDVKDGSNNCVLIDKTTVTAIWAFVVAIYCIGGMMGGAMVGMAASYCGRKRGLLLNNVFVVIAVVLMGTAKIAASYKLLLAGRLGK